MVFNVLFFKKVVADVVGVIDTGTFLVILGGLVGEICPFDHGGDGQGRVDDLIYAAGKEQGVLHAFVGRRADDAADLFNPVGQVLGGGITKQHQENIVGYPAEGLIGLDLLLQAGGDVAQGPVSFLIAEHVVDAFEFIHIQLNHGIMQLRMLFQ